MTRHGVLCACTVCERADAIDDRDGKTIARAAEWDHLAPCD